MNIKFNVTHRERHGNPYGGPYDCMDCHGTDRDTHGRCGRCGSEAIYETAAIVPEKTNTADSENSEILPIGFLQARENQNDR